MPSVRSVLVMTASLTLALIIYDKFLKQNLPF